MLNSENIEYRRQRKKESKNPPTLKADWNIKRLPKYFIVFDRCGTIAIIGEIIIDTQIELIKSKISQKVENRPNSFNPINLTIIKEHKKLLQLTIAWSIML